MKWNKKTDSIYLACGHGTQINGVWDSGCAYNGYTEAGLMLPIVKAAVALLRKSGVKVYTDDKNDKNMIATVTEANKKKVSLYMSVHCDYKDATPGVMPLYVSSSGKKFGNAVGKYVAKAMGLKYKGVAKRNDLYELNATNMPSVILETGSIKGDLSVLKNHPKKYGRAIAKAICKYIGVEVYVSKRTKIMRMYADTLAYMNKHGFRYCLEYKKCGTSWDQAKKTKKSNCATAVSYALQRMGILNPGQIFWLNGTTVHCVGSGCSKAIKKHFTIKHPKKSPKKSNLKGGYICGYKDNAHTQMFAKYKTYTENGKKIDRPLWYSWGRTDVGKSQPRRKKSYDTKAIMTLLVPKE